MVAVLAASALALSASLACGPRQRAVDDGGHGKGMDGGGHGGGMDHGMGMGK